MTPTQRKDRLGHKGASHKNIPTEKLEYYINDTHCECGCALIPRKSFSKIINDFGHTRMLVTINCIIHRAVCPKCCTKIEAETPFLDGTSMGPVVLGFVRILLARLH